MHVDPEILAVKALGEAAGNNAGDDAHLRGCPQCQDEMRRLAQVVAVARQPGDSHQLLSPSGHVWDQILAELGIQAELDPSAAQPGTPDQVTGRRTAPGRRRRRRPWWHRPAIAAAAAAAAAAAVTLAVQHTATPPAPKVVGAGALRPLPQFPQWRTASGIAVMERGGTGRLLKVTLRAPQRPGFYEVWLLGRDGVKMIALGDLNRGRTGLFSVPPGANLAFYSRIDVSLQPFNGSTLHSRESVVRGPVP